MKFTEFKKIGDVVEKFNLDYKQEEFIKGKDIIIKPDIKEMILENLNSIGFNSNEYVKCEAVLFPILSTVSKVNNLPLWSHFYFESKEADLSGIPDYLFALGNRVGDDFKKPIVCLGAAKKDDFIGGWGQVAAEMVAAQTENKNPAIPIYGLVTNGYFWEFGKLEGNVFFYEKVQYSISMNFDKVLNILNWIFFESKKNADKLEELENK